MSVKICLDPGHYTGYNRGCVAGYYEGDMTLLLAQELKKELEGYGFEVVTTRTLGTQNPSLEARGKLAVTSGCKVFLSLHSDASGSAATRGVTCIRSLQRPGSVKLACALAKAVKEAMGTKFSPYAGATADGEWTRAYSTTAWGKTHDYYGVIRAAVTGACVEHAFLLEHSFHTNPTDCAFLDTGKGRAALAKAEAKALAEYFGMTAKPDQPAQPQQPAGVKYIVQAGAFAGREAAQAQVDKLAGAGFPAFIKEV